MTYLGQDTPHSSTISFTTNLTASFTVKEDPMPEDTHTDMPTKEILYIADPMCSWCWGFTPSLQAMAERATGLVSLTMMMGGLRPLTRSPMDEAQRAEIRHHWEAVEERSGQPFNYDFFEQNNFTYDTEPACRAVCVVRTIARPLVLDYFEAVQRAFYVENRDVTDGAVLQEIARKKGIDHAAFAERFNDIGSAYQTAGDFQSARQLKVTGYPTVMLRDDQAFGILTTGYQPWEDLAPTFETWLHK